MQITRQILDREDCLELTRRMTVSRNCFSRLAGAYLDEDGFIDGTFNIHFGKLSPAEKEKNLAMAKAIPFSKTNEDLKGYHIRKESRRPGTFWQLLMALRECELKNDALMDTLYEMIGEVYQTQGPYAIYVFYGTYDVPVKNKAQDNMWESEEVYSFMVCTIASVTGDYEAGKPECGFLFPLFANRSTDETGIAFFHAEGEHPELLNL